jgi:bis(5'-nucleosyl)-tetraphosphatase (symmetrical)
MRFCKPDSSLDFTVKENAQVATEHLIPWYHFPDRKTQAQKIIFGHWAALNGITNTTNVFALDTGCVWGGTLTAIDLDHLASANETIRSSLIDQGLKIKTLSVAGYDHPLRM